MSFQRLTFFQFLVILSVYSVTVFCETGCPDPEDIAPCTCTDVPTTRLICSNIQDASTIKKVFNNSERYFYQEVHIRSSFPQFVPHEIFEKVKVAEFFVEHTTLVELFNKPVRSNSFYKLQLINTNTQRGSFYDNGALKNVSSLRYLIINFSKVKAITSDFSEKLPGNLKEVSFNNTEIKTIHPSALTGLENLDKFAVQRSKLTNLSRNMFPKPFNARFLYFDHNQITFIPEDLFTDMPNLQFLTMRYNHISTIPEAAFDGRTSNVPFLGFEGNPLKCNCLLVWMIRDKPEIVGGNCTSPRYLHGKDLQNLLPGDFNC